MRQYLRAAAFTFIIILAAVACLARLIDPSGYWDGPVIEGLNKFKPASGGHAIVVKLRQLERIQPTTLLAGNSRVDIGVDPQSPAWPRTAMPVYNLGLPGVDTAHVVAAVRRALRSAGRAASS